MYQVLGLTSYSHWPEAAKLRECACSHGHIQHQLQQLAEARVRAMLHVGVMEELHLSIASLAVSLCASGCVISHVVRHTVAWLTAASEIDGWPGVCQATLGVKLDGPTWRSSTPHAFSYEVRGPGTLVRAA